MKDDGSEGALELLLQESKAYRDMVSVLLTKLHEAYRRETYRLRENHVNINTDR